MSIGFCCKQKEKENLAINNMIGRQDLIKRYYFFQVSKKVVDLLFIMNIIVGEGEKNE